MTASRSSSRAPRILVVGRDPQILALVTEEVAQCGFDVSGATAEAAAGAGAFDLVAFGAAIPAAERARLEHDLLRRNPAARFVRTYAPYAAAQIVAAARAADASPSVDLPAYFARIGYDGPVEPTFEVLQALHARHIAAIPFEAIDVLLDRGIDLAPAAVDAKLVGRRRGGYCFEQNGLFKRVLAAIGFDVEGLSASVRWLAAPGTPPPPRTHMALRVTIGGTPWLVDAGFGSTVPAAPLRIDTAEPQPTRHETFRILPLGAGFLVQALIEDRWQSLYDVSPEPLLDDHYAPFNWFTSTHPSSHFRQRLLVARTTAEARYALLEGRLTIRPVEGEVERHRLDADAIERVLAEIFHLPPAPEWRDLIARAAARTAAEAVQAQPAAPAATG